MAVDVVLGRTYDDARAYVLTHEVPAGTRLVSATAPLGAIQGIPIGRVIETPDARTGRNYAAVRAVLDRSARRYSTPLI